MAVDSSIHPLFSKPVWMSDIPTSLVELQIGTLSFSSIVVFLISSNHFLHGLSLSVLMLVTTAAAAIFVIVGLTYCFLICTPSTTFQLKAC